MNIFKLSSMLADKIGLHSITPQKLYVGSSSYNKEIKVISVLGKKKLLVNGLVQSLSPDTSFAKRRVWGQLTKIVATAKPAPKNILLLGLGSGTMVTLLNNRLGLSNINITSVEIDKTIVALAHKYFDLDKQKNNKTIIADAYDVILNPHKYDLADNIDCVIVDTYLGDNYPKAIETRDFLEALIKIGERNTLYVFNRVFSRNSTAELNSYVSLLSSYIHSPKIKRVNCHSHSDNYIIYGYRNT